MQDVKLINKHDFKKGFSNVVSAATSIFKYQWLQLKPQSTHQTLFFAKWRTTKQPWVRDWKICWKQRVVTTLYFIQL